MRICDRESKKGNSKRIRELTLQKNHGCGIAAGTQFSQAASRTISLNRTAAGTRRLNWFSLHFRRIYCRTVFNCRAAGDFLSRHSTKSKNETLPKSWWSYRCRFKWILCQTTVCATLGDMSAPAFTLAAFSIPGPVFWPYFLGLALLAIGLPFILKYDVPQARGLDKLMPFGRLLYASPWPSSPENTSPSPALWPPASPPGFPRIFFHLFRRRRPRRRFPKYCPQKIRLALRNALGHHDFSFCRASAHPQGCRKSSR